MLSKQVDHLLKDGKKIYEDRMKLDEQKAKTRIFGNVAYWKANRKLAKE